MRRLMRKGRRGLVGLVTGARDKCRRSAPAALSNNPAQRKPGGVFRFRKLRNRVKPRFKPISWASMPISARKCHMRAVKAAPHVDGLVRGVEWFVTFAEPNKMYLRTREMRWFVAGI